MIITDDKLAQVEADAEQLVENPPPYSFSPGARVGAVDAQIASPDQTRTENDAFRVRGLPSRSSASSTAVADSGSCLADFYAWIPPPPDVRRTSLLRVQRTNRSVSERIVVDPYFPSPPFSNISGELEEDDEVFGPRLGSPAPGDPEKKNVLLECKNGSIDAEIWAVGRPADNSDVTRKAGIDIRAANGLVRVKMHASPSSPPFALRVAARNGGVRVALPRSFVGPLTTHTRNGWITLSPALASCTTAFSEMLGTRKSFVGDFVECNYGKGDWHGSSLAITCENGRIRLCYVDEDVGNGISGLLGRFLK